MNKKIIVLVILMACAVGMFAQTANAKKNTVLGGLVMLSYERSLASKWSVGGEFDMGFGIMKAFDGLNSTMPGITTNFSAFGRWYPTQKGIFFSQLGLGYTHNNQLISFGLVNSHDGFLIKPEVGARFVFSNGFTLQVKGGVGLSLGGGKAEWVSEKKVKDSGFSYSIAPTINIGFGYNF